MLETGSSLFLKNKERRIQPRSGKGSLMDVRAHDALHHVHSGKPVIPGNLAKPEELNL